MSDEPRIEVVPIDSVHLDPANLRLHDDDQINGIEASIRNLGAGRSIVLDGKDIIRAGNGTIQAAKRAGLTELIVVEPGPGQLVAVKRSDWTTTEAITYSVGDNRLTDKSKFSDDLAETLRAIQSESDDLLAAAGYTDDEVTALIEAMGTGMLNEAEPAEDPGPQIDRAEELLKKWQVELGQLWTIPSKATPGKAHRLLCGDSTKAEDVARVMGGEKALLMNTDPPYGVAYSDEARVAADRAHVRPQRQEKWSGGIANDGMDGEKLQSFLEATIRAAVPHLIKTAAFYLWHPMLTQGTFFAAASAADILIHRQIIWVKPSLLFGFGDYHWQHELCFYGWQRGNRPEFYGERNQTTIWDMRNETSSGERCHPTQKPVELFARPMLNHTKAGELVYEPFAGSGSQFVAAEQTGRLCYGIEIAPKYCAVILERLAGLGLEPTLTPQ